MHNFFENFPISTEKDWVEVITKSLKGASIDQVLNQTNEIEEINFYSYYHPSKYAESTQIAKNQITSLTSNKFELVNQLPLGEAKFRNSYALKLLMQGVTSLRIDLENHSLEDCSIIIENILFEHIYCTFYCHNIEQLQWAKKLLNNDNKQRIFIIQSELTKLSDISHILIDGMNVSQCGANCMQEIAYLLHEGHIALVKLINQGMNIDQAASLLKFKIGIGSNFIFEIAKIRTFRYLWYTIVKKYYPIHTCSTIPFIEAESLLINKSLKDPFSNLLRLTTEGLSAVIGGVNELCMNPYDWGATNPALNNTQRISNNIALILKEESYLEMVIDPMGGSYAVEEISNSLLAKSWALFQEIEKNGIELLSKKVAKTCNTRKELFSNGETNLIGINKYQVKSDFNYEWVPPVKMKFGYSLILERDVC